MICVCNGQFTNIVRLSATHKVYPINVGAICELPAKKSNQPFLIADCPIYYFYTLLPELPPEPPPPPELPPELII